MVLVWEFIKSVLRRWWTLMSCAVFTLVGIYAAATNAANSWIVWTGFVLAFLVLIVAFYHAWREERILRGHLETGSGPNILLQIKESDGATGYQVIELINDGSETAIEVLFEEVIKEGESEPVRLLPLPWQIPYIRVGEPQQIKASFYRNEGNPPAAHHRPLGEFLAGREAGMAISVRFKNSGGMGFKRSFTLKRPILTNHVQCFPGVRQSLIKRGDQLRRSLRSN